MLDLVIRGATVVDGSGGPAQHGDIGVENGRICIIGEVDEKGRREIDATDLVVSPGFVDIHTHYDAQAFFDTTLSPSPLHGVTTVFGGNCGFSIAPLTTESAPYVRNMLSRVEGMPLESLEAGVPWDWRSTSDFLDRLDRRLSVNSGWLIGHTALRAAVMGDRAFAEATDAELSEMAELLRAGLRAGAMGFSSTWSPTHNDHMGNPVPSRHATAEELVRLCGVVSEFDGTTVEFIPAVGRFDEQVFDLMTRMSVAANRPVNWNSLMVESADEELVEHQLSLGDHAASRGGRVVALTPADSRHHRVNFKSGFIFDALPGWDAVMALAPDEKIDLLRDPVRRAEIAEWATHTQGYLASIADWPNYVLVEVFSEKYAEFTGRTVGAMAEQLGVGPFDAMVDVIVADNLNTVLTRYDGGQDDDTWQRRVALWQDPRAMIGASDAGAHIDMTDAFSYGTTALQKAVRERRLVGLEKMVHMLTGQPAAFYGLRDRGRLQEGYWADVAIFDPETIGAGEVRTRFDFPGGAGRLFGGATGIEHVLVAGTEIVRKDEFTDERPGRVLKSGRDTYSVTTR